MKWGAALLVAMIECTGTIACDLPPGGQTLASHDGKIALSYRADPLPA